MTHAKIKLIFILFFWVTLRGYAQQTCYQIGFNEGREIYNEAQRLERNGRCAEAVPKFWEALRRFRLTRNCRELPANHELDTWEDRCIQSVASCGGKSDESTFLYVSPQSLSFDQNGGERSITVNTNSSAWRVERTPAWCATQRSNNRLTVRVQGNTGSASRRETLVIVANTLRYEITVEQAGKASAEMSAHESIKITEVLFAGKYANSTTKSYGEELFAGMTFICPRIVCDHLAMESKKIKLDFKIMSPDGKLLTDSNSDAGYTYSEEMVARGNRLQADVFDVSEWGAANAALFSSTGKYTFEIWCSGVKMFSAGFDVSKKTASCEGVKITGVQFASKYDDGTSKGYGELLTNRMIYLLPRISCTNLTEESKLLKFDFIILDPAGNRLAPTSGNTWFKEMTIRGNIQQVYVFDAPEWGSDYGNVFAASGIYQFEIWCADASLLTTSFEVRQPEQIPAAPISSISTAPSVSTSKTKIGIGAKAGLNMTNIKNGMTEIDFSPKMKPNFHAGILCHMNFGHKDNSPGLLSVQPELLFSRQGFTSSSYNIMFNYITVPLMIKLYPFQGLNLEFGPWFSYLLSVKPLEVLLDGSNIRLADLKGSKDAGIAVGAGYDFDFGLMMGLRYQHGLSDMAKNLLWTNRVISLSFGWKF